MIGEVIGAIASLFIERGEHKEMNKERISAFVDAVLAIFLAIVQLNKMEL